MTTAYQFFEFEVPSAWYNSEVQQGLEIHGLSEGNPATVFGSKKLGGFRITKLRLGSRVEYSN